MTQQVIPISESCGATTKAGTPCSVARVRGKATCALHDAELAAEGRSMGGRASTSRALLSRAEADDLINFDSVLETKETIAKVAAATVSGRIDTKVSGIVVLAAQLALSTFKLEAELADRAAKRADGMSDEELDAALARAMEQARKGGSGGRQ